MPICVIVLNQLEDANDLRVKLLKWEQPISKVNLIEPSNPKGKTEEAPISLENANKSLPPTIAMEEIKLLNPKLSRADRQKTMAKWLMPFGFIAGLTFTKMTGLTTFSKIGFPEQIENLIGGLLGMSSGWIGSYVGSSSVNSDKKDDIRILRKLSEEGFWLLMIETPLEIEPPWQLFQEKNPKEIIRLSDF